MKTHHLAIIAGTVLLLFAGCRKDELLDESDYLQAPLEQRVNCDASAAVDQAAAIISVLSAAGEFNGTGFLNRLNTIEQKINNGQTAVAVNMIHSMINVFDAMHRNGVITDEQYASLSTALTRIIGAANGEGIFTDPRDGQTYRWVLMPDCQIWMSENLNYAAPGSQAYADYSANSETFGRLYTFGAALQACPAGWRLPTYLEWRTMVDYYGGLMLGGGTDPEAAYNSLISPIHGGNSSSGFDAVLGGHYYYGNFNGLGEVGLYWTSTPFNVDLAWRIQFTQSVQFIQASAGGANETVGLSCRCIMGDPPTQPLVTITGSADFCSYDAPTPSEPTCTGPVQLELTASSTCGQSDITEVLLYLYGSIPTSTGYTYTQSDASGHFFINAPNLPIGPHKFRIRAEDDCGNINYSEVSFVLRDCKSPAPICINGISFNLMLEQINNEWVPIFDLSPADLIASNITDCSMPLTYYVIKVKDLPGGSLNNLTAEWLTPDRTMARFTCEDVGTEIIALVAKDAAGNFDYCETYAIVMDPNGYCEGP